MHHRHLSSVSLLFLLLVLVLFFPIGSSLAEGFNNTTLDIFLTESSSSNSITGFFNEYAGRPFSDWASWKLSFIGAFISMIIITIIFAYVGEGGRSNTGEFMHMAIVLLVGTPILTFIYRILLI